MIEKMNKTKNESSDKIIFFYQAFKERKNIEAHIFNDVFSEFEEKFHNGSSYKSTMSSFKKYMKISAENKGHEISIVPVSKYDTLLHGIKNIWIVNYFN